MYTLPYAFMPYLLASESMSPTSRHTLNRAANRYYEFSNIKKNLAFNIAKDSFLSGDGDNALRNGLMTYGALTAGEHFMHFYQRRLDRFTDRHPKFEEFRNQHPIIGNIVAYTPGVSMAIGIGGAALLGIGALMKHPTLTAISKNRAVQLVVGILAIAGAAITSFWGRWAQSGVEELRGRSQEYKTMRKLNPDLAPKELNQWVKDERNIRYQQLLQNPYQRDFQAHKQIPINLPASSS